MDIFLNDKLQMLEVVIELEAESPIIWNSFPGSVVHGALGFTVKRRCCVTKDGNCEGCDFQNGCVYTKLFESRTPIDSSRMRKYPRIPPGLRLTINPSVNKQIRQGDILTLGLILFGNTADTITSLLLSIEDAFRQGIGRKTVKDERGKAFIRTIKAVSGNEFLLSDIDFTGQFPIPATKWSDIEIPLSKSICLNFTSHARIVSNGKVSGNPTFRDIFSTVLRRVTNIAYFYCDVEFDIDFKALLEKANLVEVESHFHRTDLSRYSARQRNKIDLDGITGEFTIHDCPEEILPWLAIGSRLGIGKNTSMGMGCYNLSKEP